MRVSSKRKGDPASVGAKRLEASGRMLLRRAAGARTTFVPPPGAVDDHGPYRGDIEGFIAWAGDFLAGFESATHLTGNQLVEIDGDIAWHEAYARAYHRSAATADSPAQDWVLNLRYVDPIERLDGN